MKKTKNLGGSRIYISIAVCIFIFIFIGLAIYLIAQYESRGFDENVVFVYEIIDGDTFKMSDGEVVRLLCVDTPEVSEEGYDEAVSFLESLILDKIIILEPGELSDDVDKYNRSLRWAYVNISENEILVNKEIIRLGFGEVLELIDGECDLVE